MSVKEKLVELLKPNYPCDYEDCEDCPRFNDESACLLRLKEVLADHLIANGVTIEAEPVKHGRWVWDDNAMDWGLGGWVCSECQEKNDNIPAKPDIYPIGWVGSHYCPNCGAKMDLEVSE